MTTRKKGESKSAKWMTREGGIAGRSNVQPPEILRSLFIELAANGLIVKSIESKLASIQNNIEANSNNNIENNSITTPDSNSNIETKETKRFSELAKVIEELTLKPTGRVASSV